MPLPVTDRRLKPALDAIAARAIKVLSVDVFDTLLWRRVPEAKDAFWLLGQQLKAAERLAPHASAAQFAEVRAAAEKKARAIKEKATGSREIVLEDVYALMPEAFFVPGFDIARRCAEEVKLERGLMIGDTEIAALMSQAKAAGIEVVLVSDTYHTAEDIRGFLGAAFGGPAPAFDQLIISNEEGRPKWRDLFDELLTRWNVAGGDILHIGDNPDADIMPCMRLGMKHVHYDKWSFGDRVQKHEFSADGALRRALLGPLGDYGLTGLRSRLYHRPPVDMPDDALPYWRYGACVLGPVFAAFGHWMVRECRINKFGKVFGMMREGRFLNRLVAETARLTGEEIVTEEIWLSRRAVVRASLYPDDLSQLSSFISYCPGLTTDEILEQSGLSRADVAGMGAFDLLDGDDLMRLCAFIEKTPDVKAKICAVSAASRKNLIAALGKQIDLNGTTPLVLTDLGYAATIQAVLERILRREKFTVPVTGLYLALNDAAAQNMLAGIDGGGIDLRAYLGQDGFEPKAAKILTSMPYVLEHACMCREGSLYEFDASGAPILLENLREVAQLAQMEVLQEGAIAFLHAAQRVLGPVVGETLATDDTLRRQMESIIVASTLYPAREEIGALGRWRHEAKYDIKDLRRLRDLAIDAGDVEFKGLGVLNDMTGQQSYWPSAALAAISPFMAEFYAGGFFSAYKTQHLSSGPLLGTLAICPDHGAGFNDAFQGATALTVNAFGSGEIDVAVTAPGNEIYKRLRLRWPQANAVMKITSLELTFDGQGRRQKVEMLAHPAAWTFSGMREIEPGVMRLQAEGPQAVLDFTGVVPPWPHVLKFKMRYKYLKLDHLFANRPAS